MRQGLNIAILVVMTIIIYQQQKEIKALKESTRDLWSVASGESRAFVIRPRNTSAFR